ncbi:MAG: T9SS type A sorting domain-containing protein [Bacteroidota bacterium]|nr:T9SS type A sorting domain-containing protein [Bacteroidota bacterium]
MTSYTTVEKTLTPEFGLTREVTTYGQLINKADYLYYEVVYYKSANKTWGKTRIISPAFKTQSLQIIPNPATNYISFGGDVFINETAQLNIYDITGKQVHTETINTGTLATKIIDISSLSSGVYITRISGENFPIMIGKLVKE